MSASNPDVPRVGSLAAGPLDSIADVAGVTVGHCTLAAGGVQTGVTVIRPHGGDPYRDKVPAAATVLNGFGKSVGLVQVDELGVLETPVALTNTFAVGAVAQAQIRAAVAANPEIGRALPTVNPLVFECNDGYLNDIQRMAVAGSHYDAALADAGAEVAQGAVGAGRGMSAFGVKGGIGSASRVAGGHRVGALVLANFGTPESLTVAGRMVGPELARRLALPAGAAPPEKGSIIMIVATDAPLDARQLRRLSLRAGAGLARTGSVFGHGSGDIALAFSTAYTVPDDAARPMPALALLHETLLDPLFRAAADSVEQAILHALWHAAPVQGRDGHGRAALLDLMPELGQSC
ncbi:putative D-AMINO PEPTIDASE, DmpA family [Cupriavidus taiwanensis]|uniref:Putative D-AMINO PEPTIDASE, DmpA family n=1 Tax=Cupriavidus taiwanensis TaxID=164546 RepID=A0A375IDR8_9BURK|nr:P1 family peptidase [Cupriavidus taiwanensis]SOY43129.1 putative D-AMINO PEPTIDASE, DmpA family [Cupriavidus taiwanensis]SOY45392.1 putative D-AMINO PEPTIDASE, DmpA family [Cupriavidus taiwanensis]SOY80965.1 putative D-AMINO PEPTIDASE, DmpA family [Cupriavidus taiwanensis]SOZ53287.1 putative D-AMINO PEPTIDASE, DmpA family [Cupriavidus taiwanensis]SOZ77508.1 putative D-AMINO PEPTIDASE, DmpA family [Cupriavidus taiwanensis]